MVFYCFCLPAKFSFCFPLHDKCFNHLQPLIIRNPGKWHVSAMNHYDCDTFFTEQRIWDEMSYSFCGILSAFTRIFSFSFNRKLIKLFITRSKIVNNVSCCTSCRHFSQFLNELPPFGTFRCNIGKESYIIYAIV